MTIEPTDEMYGVFEYAGDIPEGVARLLAIVERDEVAPLRAVLDKLLDPHACHYDHDGDCQEHGTLGQRPCPHARAKELLGWSAP